MIRVPRQDLAILLLNGPNLNLLGSREQDIYGRCSLGSLVSDLEGFANSFGVTLTHMQSNAEHVLIEAIHSTQENGIDFVIINPGAYGHTSIAIRDAFLAIQVPFIEVHISNTSAREEFRHKSYLTDIAKGTISGFGIYSYELALQAAIKISQN
ncbi:MAG: type II 3-dehydroquinate dehydratase [Francisellaceae bacterium]|jgi:3-dehydroquinate dehydratase II|nr:type II 3-dehydroquinate dehydratase [Francisellaceae bacterium]MBT6207916.1 type II 3-dehydroquinate dehydratase [Francisellaceae bacterium]MBT6538148.1 type II 3-dehydroquinate dehydratase [Francisellaceae bacterium]